MVLFDSLQIYKYLHNKRILTEYRGAHTRIWVLTVNAYLLGLRTHVLTQNIDSYRQNIGLFVYTGTYISVVYYM